MKRAFTLIEAIVVIVIILILAAILFPVFAPRHLPHRRSNCHSNLKQIGLGLLQYVQDYDGRFPPARVTATTGWADVAQPYIKSWQLFQCPEVMSSTSPPIDYFYNSRLARSPLKNLRRPELTVLSGDGQEDAPTWNSIAAIPPTWTQTPDSPARRHTDTANYLFADGHVKWKEPFKIETTFSLKPGDVTFAIR